MAQTMNKTAKTLCFLAAIAGCSSIATSANAAIDFVTGSGSLSNTNTSISGAFNLNNGAVVNYTLTLDNLSATGFNQINWNGAGDSQSTPNPGFEFDVTDGYSVDDTWTATLSFSQDVTYNWEQTVSDRGGSNNGATEFTLNWNNTTDTPNIVDPDNQLEDKSTSIGQAIFGISNNPGAGSTSSSTLSSVFNNNDTWVIEGVSASEVQITWNATEPSTPLLRKEWITINGNSFESAAIDPPPTAVPFEFSPALGLLGVGSIFGLSRLRRSVAKK